MDKQQVLKKFAKFYRVCFQSEAYISELLGESLYNNADNGGVIICMEAFEEWLYDAEDAGENITKIVKYIKMFTGWRVFDRGFPKQMHDGSIYYYSKILVDPEGVQYIISVKYNTMCVEPEFLRID